MTDIRTTTYDATDTANPLLGRIFFATAITPHGRPRPLVPGTSVRIAFQAENGFSVSGGCNRMWFPATVGPERLHVGRGVIGGLTCTPESAAQDDLVWTFLTDDPEWELCGPGLVLRGGDITMELVEVPAPGLFGTTFEAFNVAETGIVPAPVVDGTTITLTFTAPDSLSARAGCNTLGFAVSDAGDRLDVGDDVASTRMACTPELMAQDEWLIALMTADPEYTLVAGELTLTRGGTTIELAAQISPPS